MKKPKEDTVSRGMRVWIATPADGTVQLIRAPFQLAVLPMKERLGAIVGWHSAHIAARREDDPQRFDADAGEGWVIDVPLKGIKCGPARSQFAYFIGDYGEQNAYDFINTVLGDEADEPVTVIRGTTGE